MYTTHSSAADPTAWAQTPLQKSAQSSCFSWVFCQFCNRPILENSARLRSLSTASWYCRRCSGGAFSVVSVLEQVCLIITQLHCCDFAGDLPHALKTPRTSHMEQRSSDSPLPPPSAEHAPASGRCSFVKWKGFDFTQMMLRPRTANADPSHALRCWRHFIFWELSLPLNGLQMEKLKTPRFPGELF